MRTPRRIQPLVDDGLVDEVIRPLMSGKEADVFAVRCGAEIRCAKVYKEANKRGFKQAVQYQEGRKVRNSRRARAMEKRSRFGREQQEQAKARAAWPIHATHWVFLRGPFESERCAFGRVGSVRLRTDSCCSARSFGAR